MQCSAKVLTLEAGQIATASTTKEPSVAGHFAAGHFDAGHFDAGHFDAGPFDAGHFDAGHFDAGHFDAGHMPVFRNAVTATNARL